MIDRRRPPANAQVLPQPTPVLSPRVARQQAAVTYYNNQVKGLVAAGKYTAANAPYADPTTSPEDLSNMIHSNGVPWSGSLPSEQGVHSGSLGSTASRVLARGNPPAPASPSSPDDYLLPGGVPAPAPAARAPALVAAVTAPAQPFTPPGQMTPGEAVNQALRANAGTSNLPPVTAPPAAAPARNAGGYVTDAGAENAATIAYDQAHPTRNLGQFYGAVGQAIRTPPPISSDLGTTAYANGGYATVGQADPNGPAGGGTGIYLKGIEQAKDANGNFVPATSGPPAPELTARDVPATAGLPGAPANPAVGAATSPPPTLDNESQKAIVAAYPEVGNAGSYANKAFLNALRPGQNTLADAQGALKAVIAPPTPPTAAGLAAQAPTLTLPDPGFAPQTGFGSNTLSVGTNTPNTRNPNNLSPLPPGTSENIANSLVIPRSDDLSVGAPTSALTGFDAQNQIQGKIASAIGSLGPSINASDLRAPTVSPDSAETAAIARNSALGGGAIAPSLGGLVSRVANLLPQGNQQPHYDPGNGYAGAPSVTPPGQPATGNAASGAVASSAQLPTTPPPVTTAPMPAASAGATPAQAPAAPQGPGPSPGPDYQLVNGQWVKKLVASTGS